MNFIDFEKIRDSRRNNPILFWFCSLSLILVLLFIWVVSVLGLSSGEVNLMIKQAPTVSIQEHPFGFTLAAIFNLVVLSFSTFCLYLIISKTKP